jgi:flagellar motor protein MotB
MLVLQEGALRYLSQRLPQLVLSAKPDYVIDNFPEYGEQFDGAQRQVLALAAREVVDSHATLFQVRAAIVAGHADKALRKAIGERAAFEREVSAHRAANASDSLHTQIKRLADDAHFSVVFQRFAMGLGNLRPIFPNAANEGQMRKNRRVEIFMVRVVLQPPVCTE